MLQDLQSFNKTQETMALLKILALGNRQIELGRVVTVADAFKKIERRHAVG